MARRRKNRTHLKGKVAPTESASNGTPGAPKSFIIKHGQVGSSLTQLVRDMRKVMEPNTASRLRERSRNKLKDYLTLAPALQVSHLLAFTLTAKAPSMRLVRLPSGPTLSFRIERYSLCKDVLNMNKRKRSMGMEYLSPPLLVLASFPAPSKDTPQHLPLLVKTFQSLFPPLSPKTISLSSARRIVLISYNASSGTLEFRHFLISVRAHGVSRRVRKVIEGTHHSSSKTGLPDLSRVKDVADYVLRQGDGYESASSAASDADDNDGGGVELAGNYVGRNNKKGDKRAVRLDEIGPRMELRLLKITEGVPGKEGAVIWHHIVKKTAAEIAALKKVHAERAKLRAQRRAEQDANVAKKKAAKGATKDTSQADEDDEGEDEEDEDEKMAENDDANEVEQLFDEGSGDEDEWDDEEEVSDGSSDDESVGGEESSESEDERPPPPAKKKRRG